MDAFFLLRFLIKINFPLFLTNLNLINIFLSLRNVQKCNLFWFLTTIIRTPQTFLSFPIHYSTKIIFHINTIRIFIHRHHHHICCWWFNSCQLRVLDYRFRFFQVTSTNFCIVYSIFRIAYCLLPIAYCMSNI